MARSHRLTISLIANFLLVLVLFGRLFWTPGDVARLVEESSKSIESRLLEAEAEFANRASIIDARIAEIQTQLEHLDSSGSENFDGWRKRFLEQNPDLKTGQEDK